MKLLLNCPHCAHDTIHHVGATCYCGVCGTLIAPVSPSTSPKSVWLVLAALAALYLFTSLLDWSLVNF